VLGLDAAKGFAPVALFPAWFGFEARGGWAIACGVAAIAGHVRPVFLMGQGGGKGVATAAGVFGALVPWPLVIALVAFTLVLVTSRFVSLASLTGVAVLPVAVAATSGVRHPLLALSLGVCLFVFWTHRSNIGRLRRGQEPRLSLGRDR
jgi:glycerol-3-phosphate acyltransferase PlsY